MMKESEVAGELEGPAQKVFTRPRRHMMKDKVCNFFFESKKKTSFKSGSEIRKRDESFNFAF